MPPLPRNTLSLVALSAASATHAVTYVESVDGDLSGDYIEPTPIALDVGADNFLIGSLAGGESDLDLFTLAVPDGAALTALHVVEFGGGGNGSFIGLQPGSGLSANPVPSQAFPDAIGYAIIGELDAAVDKDVLDTITASPPFNGATSLPAGTYAGWLNETGAGSTYELQFVVTAIPEPQVGLLLSVFGAVALIRRKR